MESNLIKAYGAQLNSLVNFYEVPPRKQTTLPEKEFIRFGDITIEPDRRWATINGRYVILRGKDFDIILYLLKRPNSLISTSEIFENVWPKGSKCKDGRIVGAYISVLRKKFAKNLIISQGSKKGFTGYRLNPDYANRTEVKVA